MRLVEIRLANGLLLIGPPGAFDNVILRAGDQLQAQGILRLLARDMSAQAQLRRHWPALFPRNDHGATDWPEMQHLLAQKIASRQLLLILLSEVEPSIEPAHLPDIRTHLVNLPLGDRTLLITGPGLMPPPFLQFESTTAAIDELRRIPTISSAMHLLEAQAGRLPGGNIRGLRGENLRGHLMWKLSRGALTGAVLHQPMARTQASSRADAPRPVSGMDRGERIAEAMSRSRNYLSGEILEVVEEMVTPQNLAIMTGVFLAVAIANLFPILGAAVDTTLLAIVVATIGITGAIAVGELVSAIASAMNAESEDELDAAAREFASAFVALGALALQAIMAKFVKRSGGKGEAGASAPKNKAGGSNPVRRTKPPGESARSASTSTPPEKVAPSHLPLDSKAKLQAVLDAKKGSKPPPESYLNREYITDHLAEFKDGSVYKVIKGPPREGTFGDDNVFVLPKSEVDAALAKSGGDPRKMEKLLGMDEGYLGETPYLLEFKNPQNVRMASGNEANAWEDLWEPGGYTKGGIKEAVIDGKISPSDFVATPIGKGN